MTGVKQAVFSAAYEKELDDAIAFMREGDRFLVVSHVQPDGDAISSTLVVGWLLRHFGKTVVMINEGSVPVNYTSMEFATSITNYSQQPPTEIYDRVIAVDCADYRRIGLVSGIFSEGVALLNIDHHPTNDGFGAVNVIRTDAAATVEILYDLMEHAGIARIKKQHSNLYGLINRYRRISIFEYDT